MIGRDRVSFRLGVALGAALFTAAPARADTLTLPMSLQRADRNSPRLLLAEQDLGIARAQLRQARSLYYPKVNLGLSYFRYSHETLGLTPSEMGSVILADTINAPGEDRSTASLYYSRIGFVQTLWAGGKLSTTHKLSEANFRRAEAAVTTVRKEVEFDTATQFYKLLALKEKDGLISGALLDMEKAARLSTRPHDKLAARVAQSNLREKLSEIRDQTDSVRFAYLRSMGVELFGDVTVDGTLDVPPFNEDLQTALVWAKEHRAELAVTQIQEEVDALSVSLSLSERYPVFLLGGGFEARNSQFPVDETNWNAGLSMNIPIFDGFSSLARIKESRVRAEEGRLRRSQLEDQIEMEVRSAYASLDHWKAEVEARQKNVASLVDLRREYAGPQASGSVSDRIDYLKWLVDARLSLVDAKLELCQANALLTRAVGSPLTEP